MALFTVVISRPARQYRIVEGIDAPDEATARQQALRMSRTIERDHEYEVPGVDIGEWETHTAPRPRQRVETASVSRPV